jgi:hypothetical protein
VQSSTHEKGKQARIQTSFHVARWSLLESNQPGLASSCGKFGAAWALEANSDAKIYGGVTSLAQYHASDELRTEPCYQKLVAQTKE